MNIQDLYKHCYVKKEAVAGLNISRGRLGAITSLAEFYRLHPKEFKQFNSNGAREFLRKMLVRDSAIRSRAKKFGDALQKRISRYSKDLDDKKNGVYLGEAITRAMRKTGMRTIPGLELPATFNKEFKNFKKDYQKSYNELQRLTNPYANRAQTPIDNSDFVKYLKLHGIQEGINRRYPGFLQIPIEEGSKLTLGDYLLNGIQSPGSAAITSPVIRKQINRGKQTAAQKVTSGFPGKD